MFPGGTGDGCDNNCTLTACGNGVTAGTEQCDDGNVTNGDGCDSNCKPTGCGNGVVTSGEACDDGNTEDTDNCRNTCTRPVCGDGFQSSTATAPYAEACDDGNTVSEGPGFCAGNCSGIQTCGNGVRNGTEVCDDGAANSDAYATTRHCNATCTAWAQYCGNSVVTAPETCDDGDNLSNGEGRCVAGCTGIQVCGNGVPEGTETCDSSGVDTATCNSNCTAIDCGDGHLNVAAGEECDDGNWISGDGCDDASASATSSSCLITRCGNGWVTNSTGEVCEDLNSVDGDRCSNNCTQPYFTDNRNGTISDSQTGLMWARCGHGQTWNAADNTCSGSFGNLTFCASGSTCGFDATSPLAVACNTLNTAAFAGHTNWRVPTRTELETILCHGCSNPRLDSFAINVQMFPDSSARQYSGWRWFWSRTVDPNNQLRAYAFVFNSFDYNASPTNKDTIGTVRCVR